MAASVVSSTVRIPVRLPDRAERTAKASVRIQDQTDPLEDMRKLLGAAIQRARSIVGWSLKEFAREMGRDERQVSRWESGEDRPQFERLLAHDALRQNLVEQLAVLADFEVVTTLRRRK